MCWLKQDGNCGGPFGVPPSVSPGRSGRKRFRCSISANVRCIGLVPNMIQRWENMTAAGWWLCAPVRKACFPDQLCQLFRRVLATNVGANVDELWAGMRARGGVSWGMRSQAGSRLHHRPSP